MFPSTTSFYFSWVSKLMHREVGAMAPNHTDRKWQRLPISICHTCLSGIMPVALEWLSLPWRWGPSMALVVSPCNVWNISLQQHVHTRSFFPNVSCYWGCWMQTSKTAGVWSQPDGCSLHTALVVGQWAVLRKQPQRAIALRLERQLESATGEL